MKTTISHSLGQPLAAIATAILLAGCAKEAPLAPNSHATVPAQFAASRSAEKDDAIGTLKRVTARYHDLNAAIADGFVFLHGCEVRSDEGPVGTVYVHMGRLLDGVIDPSLPDGLIYEPRKNGHPKLLGVEFAVPYPLWTKQAPPNFLGVPFQREDEFGVFGLHVWTWTNNPEGLFAESNPNVACGEE